MPYEEWLRKLGMLASVAAMYSDSELYLLMSGNGFVSSGFFKKSVIIDLATGFASGISMLPINSVTFCFWLRTGTSNSRETAIYSRGGGGTGSQSCSASFREESSILGVKAKLVESFLWRKSPLLRGKCQTIVRGRGD
ncbi:Hypothetical predicted protein [Podarcis lilfordi]|uniref:Uncharacterized protein n=1 Tax=Podarcis lilfordi TaxID=74358 RepID=A0AA35JZQ5_9SAUR|nr:Hypothetical predicted protein [Podarcis lilfordi]